MYRQMDGRTDGRMDGRTDGLMDGRMDRQMILEKKSGEFAHVPPAHAQRVYANSGYK